MKPCRTRRPTARPPKVGRPPVACKTLPCCGCRRCVHAAHSLTQRHHPLAARPPPTEVHKSASASYEERGLTAWAWLPYVNATDGFFAGQYILKKGEEMSVVRRLVGMATADAEGDAITASAAVNQDTGMLTVRVRGDRMVWVFLEALEVHGSSPAGGSVTSATSGSTAVMAATGKVLDDHMQAYFLFDKVPAGEQEDVATQAVEFLRQHPEGVLPAPKQ